MPAGGARPNSGRPKGARDRHTERRIRAIEESGLTPLAYLLSVLRNEDAELTTRLEAAKSAAPYVHPRLAQIDATLKGDKNAPIALTITDGNL